MSGRLNQRGILKGVQCVCGQWWPDYVRTENANQFRTECCGSLYQYVASQRGEFTTLSLLENAKEKAAQKANNNTAATHGPTNES